MNPPFFRNKEFDVFTMHFCSLIGKNDTFVPLNNEGPSPRLQLFIYYLTRSFVVFSAVVTFFLLTLNLKQFLTT